MKSLGCYGLNFLLGDSWGTLQAFDLFFVLFWYFIDHLTVSRKTRKVNTPCRTKCFCSYNDVCKTDFNELREK